ncbi:TFIIH complex serine/threonine-protein kinase subunit kin28 [Chytridiales sp. JEL 0842]|nr:TFIIH complex serine/threonine-protein kinase subunit kin28 [Chytridiales sp. JEL 0842]
MSAYAKERAVGIEAVVRASRLCQSVFKNIVEGQTLIKGDKSPVTIADFGAQAVVNSILHAHFPNDPIVGEEDSKDLQEDAVMRGKVLDLVNGVVETKMDADQMLKLIDLGNYAGGSKGRFWTLDPIDGTKGFLRGEQFAVCLALIENGRVQFGVLGCPNLPLDLKNPNGERGSLFIATRGEGAYQRPFSSDIETRIHASDIDSPSKTFFCESVEAGHSSKGDSAEIGKLLGITQPSVQMDSQCKYGVVARGEAGIYLRIPTNKNYEEKIWDHATGSLLIEEAGGKISDVEGKSLDFSQGRTLALNKGVIATSGKIHGAVLAGVQSVVKFKDQYLKEKKIGEGTYAVVYQGVHAETKRKIAIKKIKIGQFKDGLDPSAIREVKFLQELRHPNVIELIDVFAHKTNLNLVLEFLDADLEMVIKDKNVVFSAGDVKSWLDLKPNNLLIASDGQLKLADFGLARDFGDPSKPMTSQVVTRWYRAPELLLGAQQYGYGVDIWAIGCIFAELMLRTPYLAGDSDLGQLQTIFRALGTPTEEEWPGFNDLPDKKNLQFPPYPKTPLKTLFTAAGDDALDLLEKMLIFDPLKRITAQEALEHFFFRNMPRPTVPEKLPRISKAPTESAPDGNSKKRKAEDEEVGGGGQAKLRRRLFV